MATSRTGAPNARDARPGRNESGRDIDLELLGADDDDAERDGVVDEDSDDEGSPIEGFDEQDVDFEDQDVGFDEPVGGSDEPDGGSDDDDSASDDNEHSPPGRDADPETEADLAAMLSARLGTDDEDDEDDDDRNDVVVTPNQPSTTSRPSVVEQGDDFAVQPRHDSEWVCSNCFLIVGKASAAALTCPHCEAVRDGFAAK